jgi:ATP synthase F1, gamma subunit
VIRLALNTIKKKMNSVKKTAQITNALRLVSTTKYNRIITEAEHYDQYAQKVKTMVSNLITPDMLYDSKHIAPRASHPSTNHNRIDYHVMMQVRPVKKTGFLVITADKGLCGSYNSALLKEFHDFIRPMDKESIEVVAIGRPIVKFCQKHQLNIVSERYHLSDYPNFTEVQTIIKAAIRFFQNNIYDELYLVYNYAPNVLKNVKRIEKILPITRDNIADDVADAKQPSGPRPLIEPDIDSVLDVILPLYAETQIYGAIIDAKTAEQASRMQAMGQATDNAKSLIDDLHQEYHHERQKKITNEIIEIISGANAQN